MCKWIENDPLSNMNLIVRFIGTTPNSTNLVNLLYLVCKQILILTGPLETGSASQVSSIVLPMKPVELVKTFKEILKYIPENFHFVIIFDGLEQLYGTESNLLFGWIPSRIRKNVKLIFTCMTIDDNNTLENLQQILLCEPPNKSLDYGQNFIFIPSLDPNIGLEIVQNSLRSASRTLTSMQMSLVKEAVNQCSLPLYVQMIVDQVKHWKSYETGDQGRLSLNTNDFINDYFRKLERNYGEILVTRMISYISAAKNGLTETELLDILSLDEEVLNEVFEVRLPPIRRLPGGLFVRILNDLKNYLRRTNADGYIIMTFIHNIVYGVAKDTYLKDDSATVKIHSLMADYFLGIWADKPKPFRYSHQQVTRFKLQDKEYSSLRYVQSQPYIFLEKNQETNMAYNNRKVIELPYHLIKANRLEEALNECFFNFEFLFTKLNSSCGIAAIVNDFQEIEKIIPCIELKILENFFFLASSNLVRNPQMIGPEIIARLLPHYKHYARIRNLINRCDRLGIQFSCLLPIIHYLSTPGGPLQSSFECIL